MMLGQWVVIGICLLHSAMFSGLNLGFFGLSRLRLVVQAENGNKDAQRILSLRDDAHLLLTTLLWGNVASNVLLALVAESLLMGVGAFLFSTVGITLFGEILPQAFFVKNALRTSIVLVPIIKLYRVILYPLAKPAAIILDHFLGKEEISYFREKEIKILLERHAKSKLTDLEQLETMGAVNFLAMDDIRIVDEGEVINPQSIISLPLTARGTPRFPAFDRKFDDPFLQKVQVSQEKWVIITDPSDRPVLVLNADQFLRDMLYGKGDTDIFMYCHRPIVVSSPETKLGEVILKFKIRPEYAADNVIDDDIILYWEKDQRRIITGADILGRLLEGIVDKSSTKGQEEATEVKK